MDNWPKPFSEYIQRTVHHTTVWMGPSDSIAVIGSCSTAPHCKSHRRTRDMSELSPSSSSLLRSIVCRGPFINSRFYIDRLVMKVKMSSVYQSGSITTFKACKSTYTTQCRPNLLKTPAEFILQVWGLKVCPFFVAFQQPDHDCKMPLSRFLTISSLEHIQHNHRKHRKAFQCAKYEA